MTNLKDHLACQLLKIDSSLKGGGCYNYKGEIKEYPYILKTETKKERYDAVCKWIKGLEVSPESFDKDIMNRYAHHLNSSQVLCYVFFKYLEENELLAKFVRKCFPNKNIDTDGLTCEFEYIPQEHSDCYKSRQATNYDCRIRNNNKTFELLIEVKYTENKFGNCQNDESHKEKFEKCYRELIENCKILNADKIEKFEQMRPYYQLIRNVLQIREDKKIETYCIFLYPYANESVDRHYKEFVESGIPNESYDSFVKNVYWENLFDCMSEKIKEVYFPEEIFPKIK